MQNKNSWTVITVTLVVIAFGIGMFTGILITPKSGDGSLAQYPYLQRAVDAALGSYVQKLDDEKLAKAFLGGLDPWSTFYNAEEFELFNEATTGNYSGIGVLISLDETMQYARCAQIFKPSPANDAGVEEGWLIVEVDGEDVTGLELDLLASKIRGPAETKVVITFNNSGHLITKEIIRSNVKVNTVTYDVFSEESVAYIKLSSFMPQSPGELHEALEYCKHRGAKYYILDLRNNTGGLLSSCQLIANLFLEDGPLVHVVDKNDVKQTMKTTGTRFPYPLAVLTNRWSASASEILAGALQDREAATIIGNRTFGKGLVQQVFPGNDGTAMKISIQQYLTPNEHEVQGFGISPDIAVIPDPYLLERMPIDPRDDEVVQTAIKHLLSDEGEDN